MTGTVDARSPVQGVQLRPSQRQVAIGRRVLSSALVVLGVVVVVFFVQRIVTDPMAPYVRPELTGREIAALRASLGFDDPLIIQFADFLEGVARFDFGYSRVYGMPVTEVIVDALPVTLTLVASALAFALAVGTVAGIVAAVRRGTWVDSLVMTGSMIGQAIPSFWLGILLILLFSISLRLLPSGGYGSWAQLILPVIALSANTANQFARVVRAEMIEALGSDYIRTARAQGLSAPRILVRHALRNSLLPVITVLGVQLSSLIAGTVVIETVFSLPGVSRLLYQSVTEGDYAVTQAVAIYAAAFVTLINLVVDLCYSWLDPRVKFGER